MEIFIGIKVPRLHVYVVVFLALAHEEFLSKGGLFGGCIGPEHWDFDKVEALMMQFWVGSKVQGCSS